jgi:hypothetical protein
VPAPRWLCALGQVTLEADTVSWTTPVSFLGLSLLPSCTPKSLASSGFPGYPSVSLLCEETQAWPHVPTG